MRRIALSILFLQLTFENGLTFSRAWVTPWRLVSALLDGESTRVPLLDVGIVILLGLAMLGPSLRRVVARPMIHALLVALGAVVAWLAWGLAGGGWAHAALYQLHAWVSCILYSFVLLAVVRAPADIVLVGKTIVAAALFRAFFGFCFYLFVAKTLPEYPQYMTQHDDSVLFVMATVIGLVWALESRSRRALGAAAVIALVMIAMIHINNRRLAWASLGGSLLLIFLTLPASALRRRIGGAVLVFVLYAAIGWGRTEAVFTPLRTFQTMTDTENDASTKARRNENVSLVMAMREHPILGTGWGREFHEVDASLSMQGEDALLYHYIPHNGVLAILAFTGMLGFMLHWLPFPVSAFLSARAHAAAKSPIERAASLAALAQNRRVCESDLRRHGPVLDADAPHGLDGLCGGRAPRRIDGRMANAPGRAGPGLNRLCRRRAARRTGYSPWQSRQHFAFQRETEVLPPRSTLIARSREEPTRYLVPSLMSMSTRRSSRHVASSVPVASSAPRDVSLICGRETPSPCRYCIVEPERRSPRAMLYSWVPRGSARPTSWIARPFRGPVVRHCATRARTSRSSARSSLRSKSNFGASVTLSIVAMLHSSRRRSER